MENHGVGIFGCHDASAICFLSLGSKLPSAKFMKILDELDNYIWLHAVFVFFGSRIGQTCQREFNLIKKMLLHGSRRSVLESFVWSWAYFMKDIPMQSASPMEGNKAQNSPRVPQHLEEWNWWISVARCQMSGQTVWFKIPWAGYGFCSTSTSHPTFQLDSFQPVEISSLDTHLNPLRSIYTTKKTTYRGETVEEVVSLEGFVDILKIYN